MSALAHLPITALLLTTTPEQPPGNGAGEGRPVAVTLAMFAGGEESPGLDSRTGHAAPPASITSEPGLASESKAVENPAAVPTQESEPEPAGTSTSAPELKPESEPERQARTASEPPPDTAPLITPEPKARKPRSSKPTPKRKASKSKQPKKTAKRKSSKQGTPGKSGANMASRGSSGAGSGQQRDSAGGNRKAKAAEGAYLNQLRRAIARKRFYPRAARRKGIEGVVTVAFVLKADGRITNVRIAKGSGHAALDEAAIKTLVQLGRYKPIPKEIGRTRWSLKVPINFALR